MRKSQFSESQRQAIVAKLDAGHSLESICRDRQISPAMFCKWKREQSASFGLGLNGAWMNNAALDNLYQYTCPERSRRDGKELNNDWGLNLYDYGFRWSDQALGRFMSVDPLADKFPELTTYQYASNSPVANIDLDGLEALPFQNQWIQAAAQNQFSLNGNMIESLSGGGSKVTLTAQKRGSSTFRAIDIIIDARNQVQEVVNNKRD